MVTKKSRITLFLILLLTLFFLLFFLSILFLFVVFHLFVSTSHHSTTSPSPSNNIYQLTEINPKTRTLTYGLVHHHTQIPSSDEFISYDNPSTGSSFFITPFSNSEYKCTGTCTCELPPERRFASPILSRTFTLLISAVSSTVALQMAKRIQDPIDCIDSGLDWPEDCTFDHLLGKVEDCVEEDELPMSQVFGGSDDEYEPDRKYHCSGYCEMNRIMWRTREVIDKFQEWFDENGPCEDYGMSSWTSVECEGDEIVQKCQDRARKRFVDDHLEDYCKNIGWVVYTHRNPADVIKNREIVRTEVRNVNICRAIPDKFLFDFIVETEVVNCIPAQESTSFQFVKN